ncbi:MAG: PEP-CTERM sorting domain-containing protein [Chlorobia bacterium]|nr:PEP-CTERM sorting domain-containing protein [Fimbriimonadaceae bacterium]
MKLFAIAALISVVAVSMAQNAYFTGSLTANDPTWNRPLEDGSALSAVGTLVFYDVQPFYVAAAGTFTFETAAPTPNNYDTFAFIYQNAFNSATPLINYVAGDDDFTGAFTILPGPYTPTNGTGSGGVTPSSQILNVALSAGIQYYAINTTFSNGAVGTYFSGIGGRGAAGGPIDVTLGTLPVPEPASMVALGIGALALLRKRRKA